MCLIHFVWSMAAGPSCFSSVILRDSLKHPSLLADCTLTAGQPPVPARPAIITHNAGKRGVALEDVACLTVEGHGGAQLVVTAQPSAIHHITGIKA